MMPSFILSFLFCFSFLYATLATLNPNANITLSLQTQPSFSKDTILSNTQSEKDLQTLGVNTNLSNTEQTTQEIQSRALNASLSIDNHLFSSEGREKIKNDFLNLGNNLAQIGRGVRNNILTQSLINTAKDKDTNLFLEMYRYALIDDTLSSLFNQEELLNSLNGATNLDSTQFQEVLNEVVKIASEDNGFNAPVKLYNNEEITKGYAYSGAEGEWIGFNTLSNDMTNPNAIINTIFHETSNKELHHKSKDDAYASNRGNSAESIFALKNYQGKNTNTISTLEWNIRENEREALRGSGVLREGNEYNTRAWIGQGGGSGERDNKINPIYRDNEDKKNYNQAIAYLKKSKEFQKIFKRLEDSEIVYTIIFNDQDINIFSPFEYNGIRSEIYWDALGGLKAKLGNQSPATGLAHEMGHAYHYDTGEIRTRSARQEEEITTKLEGIIAKQLGEAIRRNYDDHNGSFRAIHPTSTQERKQ